MDESLTLHEKRSHLAGLTGEVDQLHPLLEKLLSKLPRVVNVDYTHGPAEKGADFIITRSDDLTTAYEYIGVIAKLGKIHQDTSAIDTQIDQCDNERFILQGKQKIRLSEIWVIVSENITNGAKENIHRKFSNRKIKFFASKELIELIDKNLPNFWHEIPVDLGDYLREISISNKQILRSSSLISRSAEDVYIEPEIVYSSWEDEYENQILRKKRKADIFELIDKGDVILVEGGVGFGKTTLLRNILEFYSNPLTFKRTSFLPLFVSYRQYIDEFGADLGKMLDGLIPDRCKQKMDSTHTYLLLIDGVDEKDAKADEQIEKLANLVESIHMRARTKGVISTRSLNYIYAGDRLKDRVEKLEIRPLTIEKLISYFNKFCEKQKISSRLVKDLKKSPLFRSIPRTPIAAVLLASLINDNSKDLPSNLPELYSKYFELMLGRWDVDKGIKSNREYQASNGIAVELAKQVIDNDLSEIPYDSAYAITRDYLDRRNLDIDATELFRNMCERSTLLNRIEEKNCVGFRHRTFAEYFYSQHLIATHRTDFIDERIFSPYFQNIIYFYIGQQKDCYDILKQVVCVKPKNSVDHLLRVINLSDYFMAAYTTPYDIVQENLGGIIVDATNEFISIVERKNSSPLASLSPVVLLFFFQAIVRSSYSYDYFKRAIEDGKVRILVDRSLSDDQRAYALFFLGVIELDLGGEEPFDDLLKEMQGKMPFLLKLAMRYVGQKLEHPSKLVKKHMKSINKQLRADGGMRSHIQMLRERPIRELPGFK